MTKFREIINEILEDEDNGVDNLIDLIDNLPLIGIFDSQDNENFNDEVDYEEADSENFEIEIYDHFAKITMCGDWQNPVTFDIVLIEDDFIRKEKNKVFIAINIICESNLTSSGSLF